jgi:hypothetical protein
MKIGHVKKEYRCVGEDHNTLQCNVLVSYHILIQNQ